ncbi:transferase hexapeptide (six repeat-containing protein) [Cyclobacterium lianum]|uniref:Transferase hexapeptide (Six repeat-containing protein) n=1 Tax=Cyclobacterium lianum TaxID=388280 RepID=A0A1M7PFH4_9BACT|nr:acyltransferase [Cyclobacterium lianum]SHN15746.1 transferase hexapeptide (six repeat-containing protein) [Cyclobacterium lianum]
MIRHNIAGKLSEKSRLLYGRKASGVIEKINLYVDLVKDILQGSWRLLNARFYLRNCAQVGKWVTVRGRLRVEGAGKIAVGDHCKIWSHMGTTQLFADRGASLEIGEGTFINTACIVSASERISIGKNCQIANQVIIMDGDFHGVDDRSAKGKSAAIIIEEDAWLATRSMVLKGVRIGKGAVVAAGAVVTRDVAPYTMVGGVPAKTIRKLQENQTVLTD